ncbi:MAG: hypothetical protein H6631_10860 [Anaerolineaceae bacterium]|nr:hypothetical protein [Anaerolineaceae bacterium]MCB9102222.1 hypothetical protein [Anaerolineales bacterium]
MRKRTILLFITTFVISLLLVNPSYAQTPPSNDLFTIDWKELKTDNFIIVYADSVAGVPECICGIDEAQFYAGFIDDAYNELVAIFGTQLDTPINLRLFPTEQSYYEVNPIAQQIPGVVAHALNNREEIAIALTRTQALSEEDIINNMRHELTHFFASLLSDGNLTAGFQEGIAQYVEKPTDRTSYDPAMLQQAFDQHRLLSWSQLDSSAEVFRDPQVAYPEALSIASFLIDRYGFAKFIDFIKANATEPGYRSALETTYGQPADELEAEWLAYLPDYFAGRWQINALYAYDLTRVTQLVNNGAFSDAQTELTDIIELLRTTDQVDKLAEADHLMAQAQQGAAAGVLADETRQALLANDYTQTIDKGSAAINSYQGLNYHDRIQEVQVYMQRAQAGREALVQLDQGEHLLSRFRFFEADQQIYEATVILQSLGNNSQAEHGQALLAASSRRQSWLAYGLLGMGAILVIFNVIRRLAFRYKTNPLEMEYTA